MHYQTQNPTKKRVAFYLPVSDYQKLEAAFPFRVTPDSAGTRRIDWTAAIQALLGAQDHNRPGVQL